jgi:alkanesulfonate monooxygenase SsuD/methylene tetrahydromethanopterin reductase-like flavin-dependent oxidoreductase (luciferase family)
LFFIETVTLSLGHLVTLSNKTATSHQPQATTIRPSSIVHRPQESRMLPVGLCLSTFGSSYAMMREAAQLIDDLGFDSLWVWDHYVSWNSAGEGVLDGLTTLAGLAEATRRARIGPLVANNTNRHPARLAKIAATLQDLSGGRFELGLGAGGLAFEQAPFGIDQGEDRERFGRLREAVQLIPALWSGEPVDFAGSYYQLSGAICAPAPVPRPRLILGALGPGIARLAGRYADGLNLHWNNRRRFPELIAAMDAGLQAAGRDRASFDLSLHPGLADLTHEPQAALAEWEQMGFQRVIAYVNPPFPLKAIEKLAEELAR